MNVELLRKIAAVIQEKPEEFDMRMWHAKNACATTHCIGGWAQVLSGVPEDEDRPDQMASLLGLSYEIVEEDGAINLDTDCEASRLFFRHNWPTQFQRPRASIDPVNAAARIEHFIATEGRE